MFATLRRPPSFYKRLIQLALPITLQNIITFSVGLVDTFMVSQLGNREMAAVTTANVPVFLLTSIIFGFQSGLSILVGQYWGKGDTKSISRALGVAAMIGGGFNLLLALVLFAFPVQIMDLLSNRHDLSLLGAPYLQIIGFSYVFNLLACVYSGAQRSVENPAFGMKLFTVSSAVNIGLNYLLIFGHGGFPALGVAGAAIATLLARMTEFVICTVCALRSRRIPLDRKLFLRPGLDMGKRFLRYSTPVVLSETAWGLGVSMVTVILGYTENSVEMLAANAVMGNVNRLSLVACFGLAAATAVLVGKAIGEGQSRREILSLSRTLMWFNILAGAVLAILCLLLMPVFFLPAVFPRFKLFGESARIAAALAVTGFAGIPFHAGATSAITGILRAGGDVACSTLLDLAPLWGVCLPVTALIALVLKAGCWPIALCIQLENVVKLPLCLLRVQNGKWINDVTGGGSP